MPLSLLIPFLQTSALPTELLKHDSILETRMEAGSWEGKESFSLAHAQGSAETLVLYVSP